MFYTPFLYEMNQIRIGIRTNVRPTAIMEQNSGTRIRGNRRKTCIALDGGKLTYDGDQIKKSAQR